MMRARGHYTSRLRTRSVAMVATGGLVAAGLMAATTVQAADNIGDYEILAAADRAAMLDTDPAPVNLPDPDGNTKELGPDQGSDTKLVVIHDAAVPMLDRTNPNAQVDLRDIWLGTSTAADGDQYLYFAWERDSSNGSGVLMIEFQTAALGAECDYAASGFDPDLCNPWSGRQAGDFILVWDQQGQTIDIIKRTFFDDNGVLALDAGVSLTSAKAAVSDDGFFGEAAVNLTQDVFGTGVAACTTLANVIPGTVTGNSDTADYKDTVLAKAPPISNCGSVTVKKVTDPAGDTTTDFTWTLDRADGSDINYSPATSASDTIKDGETDTVINLIAGTNYNLAETYPGPKYGIKSIVCKDQGGTEYNAEDDGDFPVNAGETTACIITNELQPGTLTVNKVINNNWGGELGATSFSFDVSGPTSSTNNPFEADGSNDLPVVAGTYNVTEVTPLPDGYQEKENLVDPCVDVVVPAGGSASCTIINEDKPATLTVNKVVDNSAGGPLNADAFAFSVTGVGANATSASAVQFQTDGNPDEGSNTVQVYAAATDGTTYTATEDDAQGYNVDESDCVDVVVSFAGTAECTIYNTYPQNSPVASTVQSWVLHDSFSADIRPGADNAGDADVTFALFTDDQCTVPFEVDDSAYQEVIAVTLSNEGATVSAATSTGASVTESGSYFWTAEYSGDDYNTSATSGCTAEITQILAKDALRNDFE